MSWRFTDWYEKNKEEFNRKRRLRYHTDPKYREDRLQEVKRGYRRNQATNIGRDRRVLHANGRRFLSIGRLAEVLNRSVQTVREYHYNGVIPDATHVDARGWRLYTTYQVQLLRDVFRRFDDGDLTSLAEVARVLEEAWNGERSEEDPGD